MTMMIEKARLGRMNALAGRPANNATELRNRTSNRHDTVTFISSRARSISQAVTL